MANPQKEDGYTVIANEIIDKLCEYRLSGQKWQILWVILRKTYGWNKKMDNISLGQFEKQTKINRYKCHSILKSLVNSGIVIKGVPQKGNSTAISYGIQKDFDKWKVFPKKVTVPQKGNRVFPKKVTKVFPKKVTTKEKKENIKTHMLVKKTPTRDMIGIFIKVFKEIRNGTPVIDSGKDGKLCQKLYKQCITDNSDQPLELWETRCRILMRDKDISTIGGIKAFWNSVIPKKDEPTYIKYGTPEWEAWKKSKEKQDGDK